MTRQSRIWNWNSIKRKTDEGFSWDEDGIEKPKNPTRKMYNQMNQTEGRMSALRDKVDDLCEIS